MSNIHTVYVDMDGVLANFLWGALKAHDRLDLYENWPKGQWNISTALGVTEDAFWAKIDERKEQFWASLPKTAACDVLLTSLYRWASNPDRPANIAIATAPSLSPYAAAGKTMWLQHHYGRGFRDFVITPDKELLGQPGAVLLDDCEPNISKFSRKKGFGILVPSVTNAHGFDMMPENVPDVIAVLNQAAEEINYIPAVRVSRNNVFYQLNQAYVMNACTRALAHGAQ